MTLIFVIERADKACSVLRQTRKKREVDVDARMKQLKAFEVAAM